jgi:hypothetical protein
MSAIGRKADIKNSPSEVSPQRPFEAVKLANREAVYVLADLIEPLLTGRSHLLRKRIFISISQLVRGSPLKTAQRRLEDFSKPERPENAEPLAD